MLETLELMPGVMLHSYHDTRFKQGQLSVQLVREMDAREAAMNALLPAVLLRGTKAYPDMRSITRRLDDLYGASVNTVVRKVGDYQTTGLHSAFIEDRFALSGDAVLEPVIDLLRQLSLESLQENGGFLAEFVESEKRNLILTIESELNDKRAYAAGKLLRQMCSADPFGVPRLGDKEAVKEITPKKLYQHYQKILSQSAVEIFYVGSAPTERVAAALMPMLEAVERDYTNLPAQTPFRDSGEFHQVEQMDVTQGKLCMGFVTPIYNASEEFAAMQVLNCVYGAGMTSKLFQNVREKMSLCYSVGSGYYGTKGIMLVSAGIDSEKEPLARQEILAQLDACRRGEISEEELSCAKEELLSGLRGVHDSPGAIESYYGSAALTGQKMLPAEHMDRIRAVTLPEVQQAARTLRLHASYFLKGVSR